MIMRRFACLIVVVATWSHCAHAQDFAHNDAPEEAHSALPWLNLDSLSATRDRPLFAPDRRKPSPPPVVPVARDPTQMAAQPRTQQEPQVQLTGIVVSSAGTLVLLRDLATSRSVAIQPGHNIGPWRVVVDSNYTVKLEAGAKAFRLEMFTEPDARLHAMQ